MSIDAKTQILSSWCAASPTIAENIFPQLVLARKDKGAEDDAWIQLLRSLNAPLLIRMLTVTRSSRRPNYQPLDFADLQFSADRAIWQGETIGAINTYFKAVIPYEAQAKLAYEYFFDQFELFVARAYKGVALLHNDSLIQLFTIQPFNLETVWPEFVEDIFSAESLNSSFAPLLNTIKLANRGFSALSVPIVSKQQAQFLGGFYVSNLEILKVSDPKRDKEIEELSEKLEETGSKSVRKKLDKRITQQTKYKQLYQQVDKLRRTNPDWMQVVDNLRRQFRGIARSQISKDPAKIGKCISNLSEYVNFDEADFYSFPILLSDSSALNATRLAGDSNTKVCYSCGRELTKSEPTFKANKFIFESPSQRLQSGGSQTEPKVCGVCAAVSFVSPIKLGAGRLVVRMRKRAFDEQGREIEPLPEQAVYLAHNQLRMFTLAAMNLIAGKYVILKADEKMGTDLVSDKLGGLQYGLYKVASGFEPEVFAEYSIEAMFNTPVTLINRHLTWLSLLNKIFEYWRCFSKGDKAQFAVFGRIIRHVQKEEVIFAIYESITVGFTQITLQKSIQLEKLREAHVRWLMETQTKKTDEKAQLFKDVAAMTGLLYPFVDFVRYRNQGNPNQIRIEVNKVIERSDDPNQFDYGVARQTERQFATLKRRADTYFSYDMLKSELLPHLLTEAEIAEREDTDEKGQPTLRLYFDDVSNAYTYLFGKRYTSSKAQREFTYQLQLSLHARFPDLISADKGE